jgi:hypothetical protein
MFEREELKDEETPDYHLHLFNIISLGIRQFHKTCHSHLAFFLNSSFLMNSEMM